MRTNQTQPQTILAFTQVRRILAKAGDVNKVLTIGKLVTYKACLNAKA